MDVRPLYPPVTQPIGHIVKHREVGKQRIGLEHNAEIPRLGGQRGYILAALNKRARGLLGKTRNGAQQSCFATAGGSQKADKFALVNGQGNTIQRGKTTKTLSDCFNG